MISTRRPIAGAVAAILMFVLAHQATLAEQLEVIRSGRLYTGPSTISQRIRTLAVGEVVEHLPAGDTDTYVNVRTPQGEVGWVYERFLAIIAAPQPSTPTAGTPTATTPTSGGFQLSCNLPFQDIAPLLSTFDQTCLNEGDASKVGHREQNRAKNNFCAVGPAVPVTMNAFDDLQRFVDQSNIPHGSSNSLPSDRIVLRNAVMVSGHPVGEGTLVQFTGFVLDAHHSNVSKGESVNCKRPGRDTNDIHIAIATNPSADQCNSITAEISPHFRPPAWDPANLDNLNRPLRFKGQMFFDGSHGPCHGSQRSSPARRSVWEIHPVYAIDVCSETTLSRCDAGDETVWTPLHEWSALEEEHDD